MANPSFFNENAHRHYPFLAGALSPDVLALKNMIVDFGAIVGPGAEFEDDFDTIYLQEVNRAGDVFTFRFRSTAPGLFGSELVFTRELTDELYTTEHVTNESEYGAAYNSLSPSAAVSCPDEVLWSGFLVTGPLELLADLIADGETLDGGEDFQVEPDLVQNLARTYVNTLNLANNDRTRVDAPENCDAIIWDHPIDLIFLGAQCLQGDVRFKAGYNVSIRQSDVDNRIEFSAAVGAGAGEACDEVPLFDTESSPPGSTLLTGGLRCNEVVRSINGIGGSLINLIGGRGVTITPDPENNELRISLDLSELATCAEFADVSDSP